jgi:hypothetical protein
MFNRRLLALLIKETTELLRNRQLVIFMLILPVVSILNPIYHYLIILREILLKGVGLEIWWPNAIAMILFSTVLLLVSANRYRKQLSYSVFHASEVQGGVGASPPARGSTPAPRFMYLICLENAVAFQKEEAHESPDHLFLLFWEQSTTG